MPREMTEDELRRFEDEKLHHRDDEKPESVPASEAEIVERENPHPSGDPEIPPLSAD